jgi:hypothetical protein
MAKIIWRRLFERPTDPELLSQWISHKLAIYFIHEELDLIAIKVGPRFNICDPITAERVRKIKAKWILSQPQTPVQ